MKQLTNHSDHILFIKTQLHNHKITIQAKVPKTVKARSQKSQYEDQTRIDQWKKFRFTRKHMR